MSMSQLSFFALAISFWVRKVFLHTVLLENFYVSKSEKKILNRVAMKCGSEVRDLAWETARSTSWPSHIFNILTQLMRRPLHAFFKYKIHWAEVPKKVQLRGATLFASKAKISATLFGKISKNVDFSLWSNCAATCKHICYCTFFRL